MKERPNVVVFVSHDTGRFYSPYGITTVDNPNFEKLAAQSVTFDRCFCTTPLCAPARAALTSGRYPHQNGMNGLPGDMLGAWDMVEKDRHLAAVFGRNGYQTVLCGFEHETNDLFSVGFEEGIHGIGKANNAGYSLTGVGDDITAWFERNAGVGTQKPFYMQIGCGETHREWEKFSPEPYDSKGVWKAPYLIDAPEIDKEMAYMQGACNCLDRGIGDILGAFEKQGIADNTIFVVTTDHGIDFPRAKGTLFDPGIEVGLFMRYDAGEWKRGIHSDILISHVDVYATILEACGIDRPEGTAGISFLRELTQPGDQGAVREAVYIEKTYHDNYDPMRGLRTDRYKYVLNFDAQTLYDVRIATAPRYNWFKFPINKRNREELYDLANDPVEAVNLADDPKYTELCAAFKAQLAKWMRETNDPLLEGSIASPYHKRISSEMKALSQES